MKKRTLTKGMLMTALICGFVQWGGTAVHAAELQEFTLDPMVVTAQRMERRDVDVPASTTILSNQDLVNTGAQNLQVALGRVPGLAYKTFAPGGGAMGTMANEIAIRGVSNGTLVLLNGSPMNLRGKYFLDAIPIDTVEKVEVIKGGSSVLYGSEAMGGVINIITKKEFNNSVTAGIGNYGQQKYGVTVGTDKLSVGYNIEKWGDVNWISESHDKGDKHTDMTGSDKRNLFLNYNINDNLQFLYNYFETDVDYDVWFDAPYKDIKAFGKTLQQNRCYVSKQNLVQLMYKDDTFKANLHYNQNKLMADGYTNYTTSGSYSGKMYDTDEKNRTYGIDLQKQFQVSDKSNLILGTTYQNEFYDDFGGDGHKSNRKITDRHIYAAFAQYDHKFDNKNELILGMRETWTTAGYLGQNYDDLSLSAQYLYKLNDNESLYASYVESFIMPTFAQMYGASAGASANPDLMPQDGKNYEVGYKKYNNDHIWKAAVYHTDISDNITPKWNTGDSTYTYKNEDFKNTGLELTCEIDGKNGFSYSYGINYGNPKVKESGKNAKKPYWDRKYGRWQLTGGIDYVKDKWTSSLQATYLAERVECPSGSHSFKEKPYLLTSLTTTYNADKQNSFTLAIDNLLDRQDNLSHTGSQYFSTPFNFMLSYTHKF